MDHTSTGSCPPFLPSPTRLELFVSTLGAATGARAVQSDLFSKYFYARTASTFLMDFFLGTFITLCMLSPQRREIANHFP